MAQREQFPGIFSNLSRDQLRPRNVPTESYYELTTEQRESQRLAAEYRQFDQQERERSLANAAATLGWERRVLGNEELPIFAFKDEIIDSINKNQLTIIVAETGAGKSTQVPQFAAEAGYTVVQTQPRRLAARTVSERIGEEMMGQWDDVPRDVSAYHTAEKSTATDRTLIKNVTDGLLLAQDSGVNGREVSSQELVILDEAHEWGMNIEMEMAFVLRQMREHPERRFVIQSATLDAEVLQAYFSRALDGELPPLIKVPGRTFPVERQEFPEETVIDRALVRAEEMHELHMSQRDLLPKDRQPTAIIITAPGKREIKDYIDELADRLPEEIARTATILPLHSKLSDAEQNAALRTDYPGVKIIVSTNVAKTSLTIPDVAGIIDCGYARHADLDGDGNDSLVLYPTSKADRAQWAGRSGRVAPGWCDLAKMNEDMPYVSLEQCSDYEAPEAQRTDPVRHVLRSAAFGVDFSELELVHPVEPWVVQRAKESLRLLGALDEGGQITTIGRRMNEFPLSPALARMMVEADQCSPQVRQYMAAIVGAQEAGGLPMFTQDNDRRWKQLVEHTDSDLLAQLDIFMAMQHETENSYRIREYDLDGKNLNRARESYWRIVKKSHSEQGEMIEPSQEELEQLRHCIYAGFPDGLYQHTHEGEYVGTDTRDKRTRKISNRSVVTGHPSYIVGTPREVEYYDDGKRKTKDIAEYVTEVRDLTSYAAVNGLSRAVQVRTSEMRFIHGRPSITTEIHVGGVATGMTEQVPAEPSAEVRDFLVRHALEHPGTAQKEVRAVKKRLEELQSLTLSTVLQLRQHDLEQMLRDAAKDQLDFSMVDANLAMRMVSIRDYVSEEQEREIIENAPSELEIATGETLFLDYQEGWPIAKHSDPWALAEQCDDVYLPDGRIVRFVVSDPTHDGRKRAHSLSSLRELPR